MLHPRRSVKELSTMEQSNLAAMKQLIESIANYAELVGCAYGVCFAVGSALVFSLGKMRFAAIYIGIAIVIAMCGSLDFPPISGQ